LHQEKHSFAILFLKKLLIQVIRQNVPTLKGKRKMKKMTKMMKKMKMNENETKNEMKNEIKK